MISFIKEDGKGFVGIHAALEQLHVAGIRRDDRRLVRRSSLEYLQCAHRDEDPSFPAVRHLPAAFVKYDEIYQPKSWSRDKVNVLLSLDPDKLDYNNPRIHRTDHDFPVAWSKMYGKGRVFYSTLGHTEESWERPGRAQNVL